jgi:hypothetical protein
MNFLNLSELQLPCLQKGMTRSVFFQEKEALLQTIKDQLISAQHLTFQPDAR